MRKGGWPLLRGEPVARQCQRFFAGARRALRRGGNPPAPAFPGGETGKGRYRIFNQSGGDRLSLQLGGHFIVATTSIQLPARKDGQGYAGARVELSHQLNGQLHVWHGQQDLFSMQLPLDYAPGLAPRRPAERKKKQPRIYSSAGGEPGAVR